jgi:integrase
MFPNDIPGCLSLAQPHHGRGLRREQLWLGVNNREPLTAAGIYQMITRRDRQCGVDAYPHRFRHQFSHTCRAGAAPEGDLMELNG